MSYGTVSAILFARFTEPFWQLVTPEKILFQVRDLKGERFHKNI